MPQTCIEVISLEVGRRHPVRQRAHVLGRQAVGAHERELLEVLQAGRVDDDAVLAPAQPAVAQAGRVSSAASSRKSDSKKTRSKAIPRRASVLRWPEMTHARVLYQSSSAVAFAAEHAFEQLVRRVAAQRQLARQRVLGVLDLVVRRTTRRRRRSRRSRRRRSGRSFRRRRATRARGGRCSSRRPSPRPCCAPRRRSGCGARPARPPARAPRRARCRSRGCAGDRRAAPSSRSRPRTAPRSAARPRDPRASPRRCRRPRARRRSFRSSRRCRRSVTPVASRACTVSDPRLALDLLERAQRVRVLAPLRQCAARASDRSACAGAAAPAPPSGRSAPSRAGTVFEVVKEIGGHGR